MQTGQTGTSNVSLQDLTSEEEKSPDASFLPSRNAFEGNIAEANEAMMN